MDDDLHKGHRSRLRNRFAEAPAALSEKELLELLLIYAIPRQDVSGLAGTLIDRFSSIEEVISAPPEALSAVPGLGESTIIFLKVIYTILLKKHPDMTYQPNLFTPEKVTSPKRHDMRVFADDEIASALVHLPKTASYERLEDFKKYLSENLPYNAAATRQRRAQYILNRFFPDDRLDTPLQFFLSKNPSVDTLKPIVFYELARAEQILGKVAGGMSLGSQRILGGGI